MEIMEEKYLKEELQSMFVALEEFIETHQTLNETFLTRILLCNTLLI